MKTTPKYDQGGYVELLAAVVERANADAAGEGMGDIHPTMRPRVRAEATEFLTWVRATELDTCADRVQGAGIFRGNRL